MTKGPCRHKETWWWNKEVAEAVREKQIKYEKWKKENTNEARMEYKKSKKMQRGLSLQQRKRNIRNGQMTFLLLSVKMKLFEWQSRWSKKDRI